VLRWTCRLCWNKNLKHITHSLTSVLKNLVTLLVIYINHVLKHCRSSTTVYREAEGWLGMHLEFSHQHGVFCYNTDLQPQKATALIHACSIVHNFLKENLHSSGWSTSWANRTCCSAWTSKWPYCNSCTANSNCVWNPWDVLSLCKHSSCYSLAAAVVLRNNWTYIMLYLSA
jgi:hypothetical protein